MSICKVTTVQECQAWKMSFIKRKIPGVKVYHTGLTKCPSVAKEWHSTNIRQQAATCAELHVIRKLRPLQKRLMCLQTILWLMTYISSKRMHDKLVLFQFWTLLEIFFTYNYWSVLDIYLCSIWICIFHTVYYNFMMPKLISGFMHCNSGIKCGLAQTIHCQTLKWNVKKIR